MFRVRNWGRGGTTVSTSSNRRLKTSHDFRYVMAIELLYGNVEFGTLLALNEKLCDFGTSLQVFRAYLSHLSFLRATLTLRV